MKLRKTVIPVAVFVLVLALAWFAVGKMSSVYSEQDAKLVQDAVKKAALSCYAVEGAYPESLDYLRENYGLAYDEERYIVTYDAFASNLVPDIRVHERSGGQ